MYIGKARFIILGYTGTEGLLAYGPAGFAFSWGKGGADYHWWVLFSDIDALAEKPSGGR